MEQFIDGPGGRRIRIEEGGDPRGRPVLVHHGTPGAGHLYGRHAEDARDRGIRLVAYDRPGYGGSTAHPGRSVADCAEDVRSIAEALGIDRLGVWGISGGGPHALACAALLPDLVVATGSLASMAPYGAQDLDYFSGMGQENVDDTRLMLEKPEQARVKGRQDRERTLALEAETMASAFPTLLSAVDAAAFTPELAAYLHASARDGLASSDDGWWDDSWAHLHPWGFELDSIRVPVQLWHGRHDQFVPFQHGEWLASRIPGVDAHLTDVDGHTTLLQNRIGEVHAWLLRHF